MLTSTVTSKGQVTLPASLRKAAGINPSDRVNFVKEEQRIVIEKIQSLESLYGSLANPKVKSLSSGEMNKLVGKTMFSKEAK